jgi:hypothetical protein
VDAKDTARPKAVGDGRGCGNGCWGEEIERLVSGSDGNKSFDAGRGVKPRVIRWRMLADENWVILDGSKQLVHRILHARSRALSGRGWRTMWLSLGVGCWLA